MIFFQVTYSNFLFIDGPNIPSTHHYSVIVTDEYCPTTLSSTKLPKLSLNWVIQSLICESVRPYDGHESYIAINDTEEEI